ncbi:integral membrane protein [Colletotrichum tofieldiae]|uniref:Integral membrane protein n=1 Tax=Colletotrichum tofieldiae TaxID=708197 RepID=A0A161VEW0_9PEZI|nr:integral membrane protein [Colletotrichum tofieldiae]
MSHRQPPPKPARSSRPQTAAGSGAAPMGSETKAPAPKISKQHTTTLAAPKPVRPVSATLQPPTPQWTGNPSPPSYTSFNVPPPASPAPNASAGGPSAPPRKPSSSPGVSASGRLADLRSPGPGALTSFPPPPPTPPQREATSYFPKGVAQPSKKPSTSVPTAARVPASVAHGVLTPPEKATSPVEAPVTKQRPGIIDFDNLEETLQNLRFAPSPMLSTIYSVPSTPRDELSTPDFTTSTTTSCFTPPSTNPTPEPVTPLELTPRGPPPAIKEPIVSPTRPRANSRRASPPSRKRGRGVVACIDSPVTFCTTWYTHPTAPDFSICSRCYEDHLVGTRFEHDFRGKVCDDNKPRVCRFSKPRIKDHLLRNTLATGRIEDLVSFLRHRGTIPDCRGLDGVRGSEGAKWYRPKNNAVPNMVVCQACFEDRIQPYGFAANFEAAAGQAPNDVWSCDLSIQYIQNIYKTAAARNDWAGFTKEAVARMNIPTCAKRQKVTVGSRKWFTPTADHEGVLVCAACYSDHIVGSDEERKWRDAGDNLASRYGSLVYCVLGHFNVGIAMSRAIETKDFSIFWKALGTACSEEFCNPQGIKDGKWYTFPSHPEEFGICASCVATIAEPLGLASSLVPKCGVPPSITILCSFNPASPRFVSYMTKLLEGFFTADTQPLESYALEFASLPLCPRDEDFQNRRWYGWKDCTICPSCYHEFVRGTALAASMSLKGDIVPASLMCEMYSPRMRGLYVEACARSPPDASELLKMSKARRAVYVETVPTIREMIMEAQVALGQQRMLNGMGSTNRAMGQIQEVTRQSPGVYNMPGVGFGFSNHFEMQGALYGKQANSILAEYGSGTRTHVIKQLERRWREVE